jgi:DNA-binding Lrp family transcriptional regulator
MQDPDALDETDLEIVNTLQLAPRASWTELGAILEVDPTTLARRWQRLVDEGITRITAFPRQPNTYGQQTAFIEVRCANGAVTDIATAVAEHAKTLTVEITTGAHQILVTALGDPRLSDYVLDYLSTMPGIVGYRTHILIGIPYEAHRWHVRALSPAQYSGLRALARTTGEREYDRGRRITDLDPGSDGVISAGQVDVILYMSVNFYPLSG